jgi:plastocyanin
LISFVRQNAVVMLLAFSLGLSGCGNDDDPTGPPVGPPGNNDDPVATTSVDVRDNFFQPRAIVVSPEATVTWTWQGSDIHDVTWASGIDLPDSPVQSSGTFSVTMPAEEGVYAYQCEVHGAAMSGTVQVEE